MTALEISEKFSVSLETEVESSPVSLMPWEGMTYSEKLAKTTSVTTTTHVMIDDEPCLVEDLPKKHGFTFEQWQLRKVVEQQRTWCVIGGVALTQDEFLSQHPHLDLGYN